MARGAGGATAGADSPVAISNADSHPVYRRRCAQNLWVPTTSATWAYAERNAAGLG